MKFSRATIVAIAVAVAVAVAVAPPECRALVMHRNLISLPALLLPLCECVGKDMEDVEDVEDEVVEEVAGAGASAGAEAAGGVGSGCQQTQARRRWPCAGFK